MMRVLRKLHLHQKTMKVKEIDRMTANRLIVMFGEVALRLHQYLDGIVYRELKKRQREREEQRAKERGERPPEYSPIAPTARKALKRAAAQPVSFMSAITTV